MVKLGFLYPGYGAEADIVNLCKTLEPSVEVAVAHTSSPGEFIEHRVDSLRDLGSQARLAAGAGKLVDDGADVVIWACTSGSFVFGVDGAERQAAALAETAGVPASSTSRAFVHAAKALRVKRVALAATYPPDVTEWFIEYLHIHGMEVVKQQSHDIFTAEEVSALGRAAAINLVTCADSAYAEAVLVPDTALHSVEYITDLEQTLGKPVLTANQVSVWEAARITRLTAVSSPVGGTLFTRASALGPEPPL